jgi:hypothetical protein
MEIGAMIPAIHADRDSVATKLPAKYQHALQCKDAEERCRCLKEAAEAGYIPAICNYGLMCRCAIERKHWLLEAACEGYVPAMHSYALECEDSERRNRWLREAARNGHVEAMYLYSIENAMTLPKPCTGCVKRPWKGTSLPSKPVFYDARSRKENVGLLLPERRRW